MTGQIIPLAMGLVAGAALTVVGAAWLLRVVAAAWLGWRFRRY